ncbi:PilZ domain-containing protein [Rhizobiaceae bacterium n13]|uniref:PilZ domain-containing protein n=1 Tax=Ferirhizobium litorale TaxID=2927786 RepID=A0AAE3TZT5_9HYPH|nr:PilZ domain-containing protein [Fererhizobium litorale]MDI7861207.1 PilZ domain-containing protein [Fererhizobium litorale]MDI7921354.1 PilZ domain-containing protein [Fererhizobium litorale]
MHYGTHLATVKSEMYERQWERFYVRRPARLIAVQGCLSGVSIRSCEVLDISQGGAALTMTTTTGLPSHYYLNILGLAYRIGCAEIYRNGERVGVKFINALDPATLRNVVRADFMMGNHKPDKPKGGEQPFLFI